MNRIYRIVMAWWPSMITLAVVLYATLWPDPELPEDMPPIPYLDKIIHAIMMGGLFGAIVFDIQRQRRREAVSAPIPARALVWLAISLMVFGVLDELAQKLLTETRTAEFLDLMADWSGIWIAFFIAPPAVRAVLKMKKPA